MPYAVAIAENYACVVGRHVAEGQSVAPGTDLLDIMTQDGMVETIQADCWGIVAHVEGGMISAHDIIEINACAMANDVGPMFIQGDIVCHVVPRETGGTIRKTGLNPKPSMKMRALRLGFSIV